MEIIYIEPDDDVAAAIARIKKSPGDLVALALPRGSGLAQSIINLKILDREAKKAGHQVSLITTDKISKNLASQVGITVYPSANEAKLARPSAPVSPVADSGQMDDSDLKIHRYSKDEEGETEADSRTAGQPDSRIADQREGNLANQPTDENREDQAPQNIRHDESKTFLPSGVPMKKKNLSSRRKPLIIIASIFIVLVLVTAYFTVPQATATMVLKTEDLSTKENMTIKKDAEGTDQENLVVPGREITSSQELSKTFESSGTKNIGTKASGEITFYNSWDTQPQTISAGAVLTAQNKKFVVDNDVTIPGATTQLVGGEIKVNPGSIKGNITAQSPGDDYNIGASTFTVDSFASDKKSKVYGQSSAALSGGTTKEIKIVSDGDIASAKSSISQEATSTAIADMNQQAGDNKIVISTVKTEEVSFETSKNANDEADNFSAKIVIKSTGIAFSENDTRNLIIEKNSKEVGEDQMLINPEGATLTWNVASYDENTGEIKLDVGFNGKVGKKIDENEIRNKISNKKYGTAKDILEHTDGVESVDLNVTPTILSRVPLIKSRIKIVFSYQQ
jgi:hypothetical protein